MLTRRGSLRRKSCRHSAADVAGVGVYGGGRFEGCLTAPSNKGDGGHSAISLSPPPHLYTPAPSDIRQPAGRTCSARTNAPSVVCSRVPPCLSHPFFALRGSAMVPGGHPGWLFRCSLRDSAATRLGTPMFFLPLGITLLINCYQSTTNCQKFNSNARTIEMVRE
jgi:hypothetical protein